ncbi:hypothetical protein ACFE04_008086 [Oxalis oulophora]
MIWRDRGQTNQGPNCSNLVRSQLDKPRAEELDLCARVGSNEPGARLLDLCARLRSDEPRAQLLGRSKIRIGRTWGSRARLMWLGSDELGAQMLDLCARLGFDELRARLLDFGEIEVGRTSGSRARLMYVVGVGQTWGIISRFTCKVGRMNLGHNCLVFARLGLDESRAQELN